MNNTSSNWDKLGNQYITNELGQLHNLRGPAQIFTDNTHKYWIIGQELSREDWLKHPLKTKYSNLVNE